MATAPRAQRSLAPASNVAAPRAGLGTALAAGAEDGRRFGSVQWGTRFNDAIARFNRPWLDYHHRWYHGAWNNWWWYPSFWVGLRGGAWLGPWGWGDSYSYYNPYWYMLPDVEGPEMMPAPDYSSPIPVPSESEMNSKDEAKVNSAMGRFATARAEFKKGRYSEAAAAVDRAVEALPGDRSMHEFRALTLFAQKKYDEAAAAAYAVLAEGPGWDWDTMAGMYEKPETYTKQLRDLEAFVSDHPKNGATHFLLGYHYLVVDERKHAIEELRAAAKLTPKDKLSALLADALEKMPPKKGDE
jgi:tetratricopeptide (TPR) repeat protein